MGLNPPYLTLLEELWSYLNQQAFSQTILVHPDMVQASNSPSLDEAILFEYKNIDGAKHGQPCQSALCKIMALLLFTVFCGYCLIDHYKKKHTFGDLKL